MRGILLPVIVACLLAFPSRTVLAEDIPPRSVLILNPSTSLRPWPMAIITATRLSMRQNFQGAIFTYVEHLNLPQFGSPNYQHSLQAHLANKYRDTPFDVIIALGFSGVDFAISLRSFWPTVPIVFAAVDEITAKSRMGPERECPGRC